MRVKLEMAKRTHVYGEIGRYCVQKKIVELRTPEEHHDLMAQTDEWMVEPYRLFGDGETKEVGNGTLYEKGLVARIRLITLFKEGGKKIAIATNAPIWITDAGGHVASFPTLVDVAIDDK